MLTKKVLNWVDKKYDEIYDNKNTKFRGVKEFGLGVIEGAIDGAILAYPILLITCVLAGKKLNDK